MTRPTLTHAASLGSGPRRLRDVTLVATSVAVGVGIVVVRLSPDAVVVAAIGVLCVAPLLLRAMQHRFDFFEPLVITNLAFLVMYVARPTAMLIVGGPHEFKGYVIDDRLSLSLLLALLGVAGTQIGYALPWAARKAARMPLPLGEFDVQRTVVLALGISLVGLALFAVFLYSSGGLGVLQQLLTGRSQLQESYFRGSSAYFYSAPQLLWPASLLLMAMGIANRRREFVLLSFAALVPLAIFAGGRGARIILVPLLLSPVVYRYLARNRRPRPLVLFLGLYLIFTVGIAYFRDTRTTGVAISRTAELRHAVLDPSYEFRQLVLHGVDADMFESLAVETEVVPSKLPISPVDWLYRTAAKPVPSTLWRGKPLAPDEQLNKTLYPSETVRASSSAGLFGDLYLFGGAPGIALGMVLFGALFRLPWEYLRRAPAAPAPQLILTVSLMFIPILLRGTIGDSTARALFGFVPLLIAMRVCVRHGDPSVRLSEVR